MNHKHYGTWKYKVTEHMETFDCYVGLEIDLDAIMAQIGPKAARNRSGRSKYMDGAVIARVMRKTK